MSIIKCTWPGLVTSLSDPKQPTIVLDLGSLLARDQDDAEGLARQQKIEAKLQELLPNIKIPLQREKNGAEVVFTNLTTFAAFKEFLKDECQAKLTSKVKGLSIGQEGSEQDLAFSFSVRIGQLADKLFVANGLLSLVYQRPAPSSGDNAPLERAQQSLEDSTTFVSIMRSRNPSLFLDPATTDFDLLKILYCPWGDKNSVANLTALREDAKAFLESKPNSLPYDAQVVWCMANLLRVCYESIFDENNPVSSCYLANDFYRAAFASQESQSQKKEIEEWDFAKIGKIYQKMQDVLGLIDRYAPYLCIPQENEKPALQEPLAKFYNTLREFWLNKLSELEEKVEELANKDFSQRTQSFDVLVRLASRRGTMSVSKNPSQFSAEVSRSLRNLLQAGTITYPAFCQNRGTFWAEEKKQEKPKVVQFSLNADLFDAARYSSPDSRESSSSRLDCIAGALVNVKKACLQFKGLIEQCNGNFTYSSGDVKDLGGSQDTVGRIYNINGFNIRGPQEAEEVLEKARVTDASQKRLAVLFISQYGIFVGNAFSTIVNSFRPIDCGIYNLNGKTREDGAKEVAKEAREVVKELIPIRAIRNDNGSLSLVFAGNIDKKDTETAKTNSVGNYYFEFNINPKNEVTLARAEVNFDAEEGDKVVQAIVDDDYRFDDAGSATIRSDDESPETPRPISRQAALRREADGIYTVVRLSSYKADAERCQVDRKKLDRKGQEMFPSRDPAIDFQAKMKGRCKSHDDTKSVPVSEQPAVPAAPRSACS